MKKVGRPKTDNAKLRTLSFRLHESDFLSFKEYASKHDITVTQLVMESVRAYINQNRQ